MSEFDTRAWLDEALGPHGKRTKRAKLLLKILNCKNTEYIYARFIGTGPKSRVLTFDEIVACADALDVPNPLENRRPILPPNLVEYPFYGEVEYGKFKTSSVDRVECTPIISTRHPLYPNAGPMAWLIKDDALGKKGYIDGSAAYGVNFQDTGAALKDGNIIVLERIQDGKFASSIERIIGIVKLVDDGIEIQTRSHDPKYVPIHIKDSELRDASSVKIRTLIYKSETRD